MLRIRFLVLATLLTLFGLSSAYGQRLLIQSTTSTQNSGLYDYLLPIAEQELGLDIDVVAVGTGQAIKNAMNGDADVLLVHAKPAELKFLADGYGVERFDLMYNDFVLIGPASDPEGLAGSANINQGDARLGEGKDRSFHAVTTAAPTKRNWHCGRMPGFA
jgi:ABC-type tungstate transport system, permease component